MRSHQQQDSVQAHANKADTPLFPHTDRHTRLAISFPETVRPLQRNHASSDVQQEQKSWSYSRVKFVVHYFLDGSLCGVRPLPPEFRRNGGAPRTWARTTCVCVLGRGGSCGRGMGGGEWSGCMKFLHVLTAVIIDQIHRTKWSEIKTGKLTKHSDVRSFYLLNSRQLISKQK